MTKIEKQILDIINPTAYERYEHKFTSLKDTCSDPNPPYTMRITPLYHFFTHYGLIMSQVSIFEDEEVEIFTQEQMSYFIKKSPLHYLYPAEKQHYGDGDNYHNILMIAIDYYEKIQLTDEQYKLLIQKSDLLVGKNEGNCALIFALYKNYGNMFDLNEENWNLLKHSARELDIEYVNKWEKKYNLQDDYFIMFPQLAKDLREIIREEHIIAAKEDLESSLLSNIEIRKKLKL
jgi:hypothetical protein